MQIQLSDHFTYRKLLRFVFPSIIMMIFTSVYGVVDGLFVSNYAGKTAFAAINIIMPFVMVLGGMGFMVGTGGSALVAKTLGEGKRDRANSYFTMMIIFTVIVGLVMTVLGIAFTRPVAVLLGATEDMMEYCVIYGRIVLGFTIAYMLQNVFQSFLVVAEKPKLGLVITVAAGVTNMVLDALFIAGFKWGVAGAAVATGISQLVGGVLPLLYIVRSKDCVLKLTKVKLQARPLLLACSNGVSEFMNNISSSIVSVVYNLQLMKYIGEDGVSAYGVIMYVQFIFIAIYVGYSIGSSPVISYNYGAGNHKELRNMLKKSLILTGVTGVVLTCLAMVLGGPLAKVFVGYDAGLCELTKRAFSMFAFAFIAAGLNIFVSAFFTALNNGLISALVAFLRTLVFQLASVLILPMIIGTDGIWWSVTIAEVLALVICMIFVVTKRKQYKY